MTNSLYFNQANLLLDLVPFLNQDKDFALKGGSAINLFVRDLERLSVDIDLAYLPINNRVTALLEISSMLLRYSVNIKKTFLNCKITKKIFKDSDLIKDLIITDDNRAI